MKPRHATWWCPSALRQRAPDGLALLLGWLLVPFVPAAPLCLSGPPMVVAQDNGLVILWRTGTELDVLGFHVHRLDGQGREARLNPQLLPAAVADGVGAIYRQRDTMGAAGYELGIVDLHGQESRVPCVRAAALPEWALALPALPPAELFERCAPPRLTISKAAAAQALPPAARLPKDASLADRERLKVTVAAPGLYRLTPDQLAAGLGMTVEEARGRLVDRQFRLTVGGQRLAWMTDINDSALLFYHPGGKTIYSAQTVYWLERGRGLVLPPLDGPAPAAPVPDPQSFPETVRFEQDKIGAVFACNDPTVDFWVWESFYSGDKKSTFPFTLEAMVAPAGDISVVLQLLGGSLTTHRADVFINNTLVGSGSGDGKNPLAITCSVPAALVVAGTNILGISNATVSADYIYLDYFDVAYRRRFTAVHESLRCVGETNNLITMRGFSNSAVRLAEVSDPRLLREIKCVRVEPDGNTFALTFAPANPTNRYYAFSPSALLSPVAIEGWDSPGLKSATNAADYLVITASPLTNALRPLVEWRTLQGRVGRMIEVRAIADEFGYGNVTPQAIQAFLAHAIRNWRLPPRAVLLGGKGTYDYRNDTGTAVNHVPILLVPTSTYLFASDNALADVAGNDGVPEVAIGRLPATTSADMSAMVGRIIAYEQDAGGDWTRRAILTADDPDEGGDFPASSEAAAVLLPSSLSLQRIYLTTYPVSTARTLLLSAINNQAGLWNYFGHGGFNVMDGGWLGNSDVSLMTNGCRGPVLLGMTCFIARHELPGYASLGETLMIQPNGGMAALWAPTGLSYDEPGPDHEQRCVAGTLPSRGATVGGGPADRLGGLRRQRRLERPAPDFHPVG
ncbi:MAG: C25 family cysteine peptidase [Verrucomicrobiota bacterium]